MKKSTLTEDKAEKNPTGGVLVGKREGQTIIHNKGTLSGYLVGKTHAEGGIKAINKSTGQALEMQGGEVVITAPAVSDNTKRKFEGKMMTNREILSTINEKGGGVAFAKDGMEIPKSIKRTGASYKYGGKTMTDHEIYKFITGGGFNSKPFLDYYFQEIKDFLEEKNNIKLKEDYTFRYRGEIFTIDPFIKADKNSDQKIKSADFIIYDSEGEVIGEISFNPDNKNKFNANSDFFEWNNIKFATGGNVTKESLVRDSKSGNTPARDLNNYNDVLDLQADGMVGAETGLFVDGGILNQENFKQWFNGSKVVDKKGNPLVVYHGSPDLRGLKSDYIFKTSNERFGISNENRAYFFTDSYSIAKSYADPHRAFDYQNAEEGVMQLYLSLKNPLIVDANNQIWRKFETEINGEKIVGTRNLISYAQSKNYDGVIVKNVRDYYTNNENKKNGGNVYVAFEPNQIKLADGTNTKFDAMNPDIRYADGGKVGVETILFAVRKGEPDWNEVLITNNPDKIEDAKKWALENGFDRLRVSKIDMMEKPDFKKTFADGGKVYKARYRIIDSNGRVKYTGGTETGSWFSLERAKELVNRANGEMIYEYNYNGDMLWEVFATGGDVKPYDANMEGDTTDMMFADGGAVSPIITNWNDVPSIWKNTSKVKKVAFTNSPYDKGLYSIVAPFLGKDELRPIFSGINFDENGITVTNAHTLITLPYPNKQFEGTYESDLSKKANPEQITVEGNYPNYSAVIPKQEVTKPFFIDVYKLLQYNDVAIKFANKTTNAVNYKIDDEIAGFNAKFLNESLKTLLKLGHETAYAHYIAPNKALLLSPNKDYEIGNDELVLTMPVMVQNQSYGAEDIDYSRGLKVYYDFNDNEIHNADGSVAEFKMNYASNSVISKEDVTLLEKLANGKNRLEILNNVIVENGIARASDLETEFYLTKVELPNGIYKPNKGALEITMEAIDDFPRKPIFVTDEDTLQFVISSNILEYYIDKLKYVVGQDDLRPVMQGICLHHTSDNKLFLAGTDANILLRVNITEYVDMPVYNKDIKFIIQPKRLYDFLNSTENTPLTIKSNVVATIIESDNWSFYARNIDGNYPNYDAVMPKETTKLAVVNLEPIKKAFNSEMVKNYIKETSFKDGVFIFNQNDNIFIANQLTRGNYPYPIDRIEKICETNVDFSLKDYYNNSQSVLLFMPFSYDKQTNFSFRKDLVDRVAKIVNHNKLELHYTEFNRPYLIPIDSFEFKTITKEYKVREQKPSVAEIKLVSSINEVNEIQEAIETLEMLLETATRKDKKEIKEAIEVLQMLLDTYEY